MSNTGYSHTVTEVEGPGFTDDENSLSDVEGSFDYNHKNEAKTKDQIKEETKDKPKEKKPKVSWFRRLWKKDEKKPTAPIINRYRDIDNNESLGDQRSLERLEVVPKGSFNIKLSPHTMPKKKIDSMIKIE